MNDKQKQKSKPSSKPVSAVNETSPPQPPTTPPVTDPLMELYEERAADIAKMDEEHYSSMITDPLMELYEERAADIAKMDEEHYDTEDAPTKTTARSIVVPRSLWDGKPPATVRNAMRPKEEGGEGFSDAIIAYVLFNWCGLTNKTQLGRLLGEPNKVDSSYFRHADRLLAEAASLTITHD